MACKILVAIDESKSSLKAIRYVAETMKCEMEITLLSILPDAIAACGLDGPSLIPLFKENREAFCSIEDAKRENVQTFINQAKEALVMAGFSPKNVKLKIRKKKKGIAQDIMKEARDGGYDTIVVGRRGLSGLKEFFMGSVSNKVVHSTDGMAVIVVD
ncbi:MAG: universal stress protein [Desulfobacterium sp.]|jgi:nucleotide-binding universal stress UspA family protein|nr:universal stress protein [Desulfobacterium sp.]